MGCRSSTPGRGVADRRTPGARPCAWPRPTPGEPFDLALGPLMRAALLRLASASTLLYYNVHHIAYDGWSMGIFVRELAALYDAFAAGRPRRCPSCRCSTSTSPSGSGTG